MADDNFNGTVDAPDDNIWRDSFVEVATAAIPEPTDVVRLVAGLACLTGGRVECAPRSGDDGRA